MLKFICLMLFLSAFNNNLLSADNNHQNPRDNKDFQNYLLGGTSLLSSTLLVSKVLNKKISPIDIPLAIILFASFAALISNKKSNLNPDSRLKIKCVMILFMAIFSASSLVVKGATNMNLESSLLAIMTFFSWSAVISESVDVIKQIVIS